MNYVNFNDESLPIGIRKQAYVKWAVAKGTHINIAKRQANKKFGFEQKPGLLVLVNDYGRMNQNSFSMSDIYQGYDTRRYKQFKHIVLESYEDKEVDIAVKIAKANKWDVVTVNLIG
jgi:hypothetical protein